MHDRMEIYSQAEVPIIVTTRQLRPGPLVSAYVLAAREEVQGAGRSGLFTRFAREVCNWRFRGRPDSNSTEQTVGELEERLGWNPDLLLFPMLLPCFCLELYLYKSPQT